MIKRCVKLDKSFRYYQFLVSTGLTVRLPFPRESRHILCLLIAAYVLSLKLRTDYGTVNHYTCRKRYRNRSDIKRYLLETTQKKHIYITPNKMFM